MSLFDDLRAVADDLNAEFANGSIALVREVATAGAEEWSEETVTLTTETLSGRITGVPGGWVDGTAVLRSDEMLSCAWPDTAPLAGDKIVADHTYITTADGALDTDGRVLTIVKPMPLFTAGEPVLFRAVLRG